MREIVRDGEMMIYQHDGYWQPMDTFRDFTLLNRLYEEKRAPWVIW
jgi:glucose-1-phosphate cytidylyltransferase